MSESSTTSVSTEGAFARSDHDFSKLDGEFDRVQSRIFDELGLQDDLWKDDDERTFREAASNLAGFINSQEFNSFSACRVVKNLPCFSRLLVGYADRMPYDEEREIWPKYKGTIDSAILRVLDASANHFDFDLICASQMALLEMCPMLPTDLLEEKVFPSVLEALAGSPIQAAKINAVTLFVDMLELTIEQDSDQEERIVMGALSFLSNHPSSYVRKALAHNFHKFCYLKGRPSKESMVPVFLKLCRDENWEVRRRIVENFCHFSSVVSLETRKTKLAPAFIQLLEDEDSYVSVPALMVLGPFIAMFAEDDLFDNKVFLCHPDPINFNPSSVDYFGVRSQHDQGIGFDWAIDAHVTSLVPLYCFIRCQPKWLSVSSRLDNPSVDDVAPDSDEEMANTKMRETRLSRSLSYLKVTLDRILLRDESSEKAAETDYDSSVVSEDDSMADLSDSQDGQQKVQGGKTVSSILTNKPKINLFWPSFGPTELTEETRDNSSEGVTPLPPEQDDSGGGDTAGEAIMVVSCGSDLLDGELVVLEGGDADEPVGLDESFVEESADGFDSGVEDGGEDEIIDHLNKVVETEIKKEINEDNFNAFLYWRDPLPDIEDELKEGFEKVTPLLARQSSRPSYSAVAQAMAAAIQEISLRPAKMFLPPKMPSLKNSWSKEVFDEDDEDNPFHDMCEKTKKAKKSECDDDNPTLWDLLSSSLSNSSGQNIVPDGLLRYYINMTGRRPALTYFCAFSFPSVAKTLGVQHWPALKPVYEALANATHWKTRRTAASYIDKLAEFLRDQPTCDDLVSVFHGFMKDIDEVRSALLSNLSAFIRCLKPACRSEVLPSITRFLELDNDRDWRFRDELAKQVLQLVGLFPPSCTCLHLSPIVMALLFDRAWEVRISALQLATELVSHVSIDVSLLRSLLAELAEQLAHSPRWRRRQTFVLFCSRLVTESVLSDEMFARDVLPHLLDLSWDRIPNVRITVARTLANDIISQPFFTDSNSPHHEVLIGVVKRLQVDKDRDVRDLASQVYPDVQARIDGYSQKGDLGWLENSDQLECEQD